jgi:protoporphyrinogen oxidase
MNGVVVLGGGVSGLAAAAALAEAGMRPVTVLEAGRGVGGLAGSFANDHGVFPIGYHHILRRDRTLLYVLRALGLLERVRWKRVPLLFHTGGRTYDLGRPLDFLRYPLSPADKARFVALMLRCFRKSDWSDWGGRSADELLAAWGSPGLRERMFEPLARVKFELPLADVSAAWLGARLHYREGSTALGYMPGTNWTRELVRGLARLVVRLGAEIRAGVRVARLSPPSAGPMEVVTESGETFVADWVVSSIPTPFYCALAPDDVSPGLRGIRYTALTSVIVAARMALPREFYWMTVLDPGYDVSGVFVLDTLNETLGIPGYRYVNLVTHSRSPESDLFAQSDDAIVARHERDLHRLVGVPTEIAWRVVNKVRLYSPILGPHYANPPVRSESRPRVFFAGNYRTYPSVVSTGTAMASGFEAAAALLDAAGHGHPPLLRGFSRAR